MLIWYSDLVIISLDLIGILLPVKLLSQRFSRKGCQVIGANEGYSCVVLIRNFLSNAIAISQTPPAYNFLSANSPPRIDEADNFKIRYCINWVLMQWILQLLVVRGSEGLHPRSPASFHRSRMWLERNHNAWAYARCWLLAWTVTHGS